jgi:death-on-curing family protein
MEYLERCDLDKIFKSIKDVLNNNEDRLPDYSKEKRGCEDFVSVLDRVKLNYYNDVYDKASFLFISLNKGHYFSNGNKRLSLFTSLLFMFINGFKLVHHSKQEYENKLRIIFPEYSDYKEYKEFNSVNYAYYNLTLIIAESNILNISNDELKLRLKKFLKFSLELTDSSKKV